MTGIGKTFEPQPAGIAVAAGQTVRCRIITGMGQTIVNSEVESLLDNLRLGQLQQGAWIW